MKFSKLSLIGTAVAFMSFSALVNAAEEKDPKQEELKALVSEFDGIEKCDGSERTENICKKNCTGAGKVWGEGSCSRQEVWDLCSAHCRADWIKDCIETATNKKNNLKGTAQCN